ncbi:MAG: 16S rRNA (guanine(966)-N(2))-methyltransferase RsmD [Chlorobiales bacterium]|nr:16S rRNA (guanine(966)-N(2))-methyltransferase RsmD [Chlorobiales bacterium]
MRIIAGKYRSRVIETLSSHVVRPTSGRVRQTIFDLLITRVDFDSASVLDLFAGSGILGFESLSRGALQVTFVDKNSSVLKKISDTTAKLGVDAQVTIHRQDVLRFLQTSPPPAGQYDLIFCDPPYRDEQSEEIMEAVFSRKWLAEDGYFVYEHYASQRFDEHPHFCFDKDFGTTRVSFFQ